MSKRLIHHFNETLCIYLNIEHLIIIWIGIYNKVGFNLYFGSFSGDGEC